MKMTHLYTEEDIFKLIEEDLHRRGLVAATKPKAIVTTRTEGMMMDTWRVAVFGGIEIVVQNKGNSYL